MHKLRGKIVLSITLIILINVLGVVGYMVIEGWNFRDSLFMTVITITTVGYGEVHDLSHAGEIFTIILLVLGVGIILYALSTEAKLIIEGQLQELIGRTRLEKKIKDFKNHYIVCGYGRMGKAIVKELKAKNVDFVVIEISPEKVMNEGDLIVITGDATNDTVLEQAGIERAKGLMSVLPTDAENLFVVLSARELNSNLNLVTRASEEGAEVKIMRAGADRVISPYHTGGIKIANAVLKPAVVDFLDFATRSENIGLELEEVTVFPNSMLVDKTLDKTGIGRDLEIIIVAIKRPDGEMKFKPTSETIINAGDTLIALGETSQLRRLETLTGNA